MIIALTIVAVVAITAVLAHLVTRFLKRVLMRESGILPSSSIFLNITRGVLWLLALCIVLDVCFKINVSAVIAALGVGGIALSLGFQDTIANLIGGLQVSLTKLIKPGDVIKVGLDSGVVTDVTWRHVTLTNADGDTVIIPNAVVNKAAVVKRNPGDAAVKAAGDTVVEDAGDNIVEALANTAETAGVATVEALVDNVAVAAEVADVTEAAEVAGVATRG